MTGGARRCLLWPLTRVFRNFKVTTLDRWTPAVPSFRGRMVLTAVLTGAISHAPLPDLQVVNLAAQVRLPSVWDTLLVLGPGHSPWSRPVPPMSSIGERRPSER